MALQQLNAEMIDLLRAYFQDRNEPNFAWKSAVSATLAIPGIVAVWPMSVVRRDNATDRARDVAGGGYHLTDTNGVVFGYEAASLIPIAEFLGTNEYLLRGDGGVAAWADITGTEAHIRAAEQGLTIGGWFYLKDVTANSALMAKWDGPADERSYMLYVNGASSLFQFYVTSAGTAVSSVNVNGPIAVVDSWYHVVGWFDNSGNTINICVNGTTTSLAYANTIFDSDSDFTIGASDVPGYFTTGLETLCFLSQCGATASQVTNHFQQTRAMFGV